MNPGTRHTARKRAPSTWPLEKQTAMITRIVTLVAICFIIGYSSPLDLSFFLPFSSFDKNCWVSRRRWTLFKIDASHPYDQVLLMHRWLKKQVRIMVLRVCVYGYIDTTGGQGHSICSRNPSSTCNAWPSAWLYPKTCPASARWAKAMSFAGYFARGFASSFVFQHSRRRCGRIDSVQWISAFSFCSSLSPSTGCSNRFNLRFSIACPVNKKDLRSWCSCGSGLLCRRNWWHSTSPNHSVWALWRNTIVLAWRFVRGLTNAFLLSEHYHRYHNTIIGFTMLSSVFITLSPLSQNCHRMTVTMRF